MVVRNCPVCHKYTFEFMIEDVWQCTNPKCNFNSNCYSCKIGECQELARKRR